MNQLLDDIQGGNPIAIIQQTLADVFGPGTPDDPGLSWLVDAHGNRATTPNEAVQDVHITFPTGVAEPFGHVSQLEHEPR